MDPATWEDPREAKEVLAVGDVGMEADRADDPAAGAVWEAPAVVAAWAAAAVPGPR